MPRYGSWIPRRCCSQPGDLSSCIISQALFLPEACDYIASSAAETVSLARPVSDSAFVLGLQEEATKERVAINVGIHEPTAAGKKVKNTSIWINEDGCIAHRYQKLHLFDVDIKNGPVLKESNSVEKGMNIVPPFETVIGRVGLVSASIVYSRPVSVHDLEANS